MKETEDIMIDLEENKIYFYFNKRKLIGNFNNYNVLGDVYYPLKTNSNGHILKTLDSLIWTLGRCLCP